MARQKHAPPPAAAAAAAADDDDNDDDEISSSDSTEMREDQLNKKNEEVPVRKPVCYVSYYYCTMVRYCGIILWCDVVSAIIRLWCTVELL